MIRRVLPPLIGCCLVASPAFAQDEPKKWSLLVEQGWTPQHERKGATLRYTWTVVTYDFAPNWRAYASYTSLPQNGKLDENYIVFDNGIRTRVGRLTPAFGFSNWSDLYYTPFIRFPQVRSGSYGANRGLFRHGSGFDVQFGGQGYQAVVGLMDTELNDQQIEPHNLGHVFGRVEVPIGNVLVGLNAAVQTRNHPDGQKSWYLGDFRWTAPRLQVYGEAYYGNAKAATIRGIVGNVVYRPPGLSRTQVGLRIDEHLESSPASSRHKRLFTAGVRQIISPSLNASLNYAWGDPDKIAAGQRGWSYQLMFTVKY